MCIRDRNNGGWIRSNRGDFEHEVTGLSEGETVDFQVRGVSDNQCGAIAEMVSCATITCVVPEPQLDSLSQITCSGVSDGQIFLSANTEAFFILGTDTSELGQTANFQALAPDTYKVLVLAEAKTCGDTLEITINEPAALNVQIPESEPLSCFGRDDGAITASASGGTGTYLYNWTKMDDLNLILPLSLIHISEPTRPY